MKKSFLFVISLFMFACGSTKLLAPTEADVERGKQKYPGITLDGLATGKMNFEQQCSKCHKLKNPASRTEAQWQTIVPKMAVRANKKAGTEVIDPIMQESILQYLVTMSKPVGSGQ